MHGGSTTTSGMSTMRLELSEQKNLRASWLGESLCLLSLAKPDLVVNDTPDNSDPATHSMPKAYDSLCKLL
jgi:hypothetical protein